MKATAKVASSDTWETGNVSMPPGDPTPNPNDRGGNLVRLNDDGRKVVDRAMELQAEVESRLVQALDASERSTPEQLLRELLLGVDET